MHEILNSVDIDVNQPLDPVSSRMISLVLDYSDSNVDILFMSIVSIVCVGTLYR